MCKSFDPAGPDAPMPDGSRNADAGKAKEALVAFLLEKGTEVPENDAVVVVASKTGLSQRLVRDAITLALNVDQDPEIKRQKLGGNKGAVLCHKTCTFSAPKADTPKKRKKRRKAK